MAYFRKLIPGTNIVLQRKSRSFPPRLEDEVEDTFLSRCDGKRTLSEIAQVTGLGEYEVTKEEIVSFAGHWDPQPWHLDEDAAAAEEALSNPSSFFKGDDVTLAIKIVAIMTALTVLPALRRSLRSGRSSGRTRRVRRRKRPQSTRPWACGREPTVRLELTTCALRTRIRAGPARSRKDRTALH